MITSLNDMPPIESLSNYGGDFHKYVNAIYQIFLNDFEISKPMFEGKKVLHKHYLPDVDGKRYTFYHITHSGNIINDRKPDFRRCERIRWVKPSIENCINWGLRAWYETINKYRQICIILEVKDDLSFYIVIEERKNNYYLCTSYCLNYKHSYRNKIKAWERAKNAGDAINVPQTPLPTRALS